ncbi:MAG: bile acid:sodium symporter [Deltaproteobacteria bacterium]|nr:bile acid:sodium symporter [Deltaproteobacteria bacterium]
MFRTNDLILLLVVFSSMAVGILWPRFGLWFQALPVYMVMCLLFLSYLSITPEDLWDTLKISTKTIFYLTLLKMVALPVGIYFLFRVVLPDYAMAALLLTGVSTGVVAPFISSLVKANTPLVLVMVIITSPLTPLTLPCLVKLVSSQSIQIPFADMIKMLGLVIFIPIMAVEVLRRVAPVIPAKIIRRRYPVSLAIFAVINFGVFSRYSDFLLRHPATLLTATLVGLALAGLYIVAVIPFFGNLPVADQLAAVISFGNMNNVLVIVFAAKFFGPLEPTVAAMYLIPFFGLILPLRAYRKWRSG